MSFLYHTFFFDPLYNALIFIFKVFPWADAGIAVIILTILVRLIIFPLSKKATVTQAKMADAGPELEAIKEKYKDNPEEQTRRTLAFYREKRINPFSGILVILIQLPIIIALFQIFRHFPEVNSAFLYTFVSAPSFIDTTFFGVDVTGKSLVLAILAGISTYAQFQITMRYQSAPKGASFGDNLARNIQTQAKYLLPVLMFFFAYQISGVIGLYFLITNLFSIGQEIFVRRRLAKTS